MIVIDSPPMTVMEDAPLASRFVDEKMFAVGWRETRTDTVLAAVRQLL
jgi:hypothetical protein